LASKSYRPHLRFTAGAGGGTFRALKRCINAREGDLDTSKYYAQLEQGARYLAAQASSDSERLLHLGWANRYYKLRVAAEPAPVLGTIAA
jgi:hypothetical protein